MKYAVSVQVATGTFRVEVDAGDCHAAVFLAFPRLMESVAEDYGLPAEAQDAVVDLINTGRIESVTVREVG